jgi:hypothetical protein
LNTIENVKLKQNEGDWMLIMGEEEEVEKT